ncbi:MAG: alpha-L-fucosidase, partial [Draconibacterium sp.]|nr:alpha-L-fucosidase [Draconibacterium sp.]
NNRLFRPWPGDFSTPEQHVPPTGLDYDWEVCMTMNTSWGYKWYDENWKSTETLIKMLVDIASKGGNLLLNVGPTAEGLIPKPSVERLKQMSVWMQQNSESIYGTSASPFFKIPWGRCTVKEVKDGTNLYFHVFDWPKDGLLRVPGLKANVKNVYLLSNPRQTFAWKFDEGDLHISAPSVIFDEINTVIVVKVKGDYEVTSNMPTLKEGSVLLPADFADIHNPGYGTHAMLKGSGKKSVIMNWVDPRARLEWMFNTPEAGTYKVEALVRANDSGKIKVKVGDSETVGDIVPTGDEYDVVTLGSIKIDEAGEHIVSLTPDRNNWNETDLIYVELVKR